jgi:2-amino-4-hydroxy-6-hydroxymethyldihydropteridine diphosphokinase
LWEYVQGIELTHGRVRSSEQNAARTLDIDLLLFGDAVMNTATLVLPHPRMHLRKFVLIPLLEIAPAISIPGLGRASDLLTHLFESDPRKVHSIPAWK